MCTRSAARSPAADRTETNRPPFGQHRPGAVARGLAGGIHDHVVDGITRRVVRRGVVDDRGGSQRRHQRHVGRAAHRGDNGAGMTRELHGERPDTAGGAMDKDLRARRDAGIAKEPKRRHCADRNRRGLLEGETQGLPRPARRPPARTRTPRAIRRPARWSCRTRRLPDGSASPRGRPPATSPANSWPRIRLRRSPIPTRSTGHMRRGTRRSATSPRVTVAARTRTRTSRSAGVGISSSRELQDVRRSRPRQHDRPHPRHATCAMGGASATSAVLHVDDAVGGASDARVVGDDDHRLPALPVEAPEEGHDLGRSGRVEVAGRLVGQQQRRLVHEGSRERDPLLLAARELHRPVAGPSPRAPPRRAPRRRARRAVPRPLPA